MRPLSFYNSLYVLPNALLSNCATCLYRQAGATMPLHKKHLLVTQFFYAFAVSFLCLKKNTIAKMMEA